VSLLAWVGCISDSHELARWFDDEQQLRADSYHVDKTGVPMLRFMLGHIASGGPPLRRITMIGRFLAGGIGDAQRSFVTHCQTTGDIAERLGLGPEIRHALGQAFERWDGKGVPAGLAGAAIDPVMRVVQLADDAEVLHRFGGVDCALEMLRARRGSEFDPELVDACGRDPEAVFGDLDSVDVWKETIDRRAALDRELSESELTTTLEAFADYADLKSPSWLGHSRGVAELAVGAARCLGLSEDEITLVERAALVHDIGVIGVSTSVWDSPRPLSRNERERVRTHPYLSERVLSRQPRLAELGCIAGMHHERMDGSGYPKGLRGDAIPITARLVATADVCHALGEDRPHRAAFAPAQREAMLRNEAAAGRLDGEVVQAVLAAAGLRVHQRPTLVAGLTAREVQILVLLARALPNKQIARELSISPRTVGSHIEHIYMKIGVTTRGAAAMFAMRHGLVGNAPEP
jgi:HD-GYP domain-containing protein (c-di-GMP phosphodiesterase class II)